MTNKVPLTIEGYGLHTTLAAATGSGKQLNLRPPSTSNFITFIYSSFPHL